MQLPPYQRRREGDLASLLPPSRPGSTEFNRAWDCIYTHLVFASDCSIQTQTLPRVNMGASQPPLSGPARRLLCWED